MRACSLKPGLWKESAWESETEGVAVGRLAGVHVYTYNRNTSSMLGAARMKVEGSRACGRSLCGKQSSCVRKGDDDDDDAVVGGYDRCERIFDP